MRPLSLVQTRILSAMAGGQTLKVHRDVEGRKTYCLHALNGTAQTVRRATVEALLARGWLDSNKKFPAATFWLTAPGQAAARQLTE